MNTHGLGERLREWRSTLDALAAMTMTSASVLLIWSLLAAPSAAPSPPEPALPADPISILGAATKGRLDAPVAMVGFSDFQCPYCATFANHVLPELKREFIDTGQMVFALRHLPLEAIHPAARAAAVAAECAREQGRFWDMHDILFKNASSLRAGSLPRLPEGVPEIDQIVYAECEQTRGAEAVEADIAQAAALGVRGTPLFFIGTLSAAGVQASERVTGVAALERFREAIVTALTDSGVPESQQRRR